MSEYININEIKKQQKKDKTKKVITNIKHGISKTISGTSKIVKSTGQVIGKGIISGVKEYKKYQSGEPTRRTERIAKLKAEEKRLKTIKKEKDLQKKVSKLRHDVQGSSYGFGTSFFMNQNIIPEKAKILKKKKKGKKSFRDSAFENDWFW